MSAPRTYAQMCAQYGLSPDRTRLTGEAAEQAHRDRIARSTQAARDHRCRMLGLPTSGQMARAVRDFGPEFAELIFGRGVIPGPRNPVEAALDRRLPAEKMN